VIIHAILKAVGSWSYPNHQTALTISSIGFYLPRPLPARHEVSVAGNVLKFVTVHGV